MQEKKFGWRNEQIHTEDSLAILTFCGYVERRRQELKCNAIDCRLHYSGLKSL